MKDVFIFLGVFFMVIALAKAVYAIALRQSQAEDTDHDNA